MLWPRSPHLPALLPAASLWISGNNDWINQLSHSAPQPNTDSVLQVIPPFTGQLFSLVSIKHDHGPGLVPLSWFGNEGALGTIQLWCSLQHLVPKYLYRDFREKS